MCSPSRRRYRREFGLPRTRSLRGWSTCALRSTGRALGLPRMGAPSILKGGEVQPGGCGRFVLALDLDQIAGVCYRERSLRFASVFGATDVASRHTGTDPRPASLGSGRTRRRKGGRRSGAGAAPRRQGRSGRSRAARCEASGRRSGATFRHAIAALSLARPTASKLGAGRNAPGAGGAGPHGEGTQHTGRGRGDKRGHQLLEMRRIGNDRPLRWRHAPDGAGVRWVRQRELLGARLMLDANTTN